MSGPVEITDAAIREVVRGYTCEPGVRELARQLRAICQFLACRRVEIGDTAPGTVVADADEARRVRPCPAPRHRGGDPGTAAVRLAARPRPGRALAGARPRPGPASGRPRGVRRGRVDRGDRGTAVAAGRGAARRAGTAAVDLRPGTRGPQEREKDQAVDYLVARHAGETAILCLGGPGGIGKTAFAWPLAAALGRRFRAPLSGWRPRTPQRFTESSGPPPTRLRDAPRGRPAAARALLGRASDKPAGAARGARPGWRGRRPTRCSGQSTPRVTPCSGTATWACHWT